MKFNNLDSQNCLTPGPQDLTIGSQELNVEEKLSKTLLPPKIFEFFLKTLKINPLKEHEETMFLCSNKMN